MIFETPESDDPITHFNLAGTVLHQTSAQFPPPPPSCPAGLVCTIFLFVLQSKPPSLSAFEEYDDWTVDRFASAMAKPDYYQLRMSENTTVGFFNSPLPILRPGRFVLLKFVPQGPNAFALDPFLCEEAARRDREPLALPLASFDLLSVVALSAARELDKTRSLASKQSLCRRYLQLSAACSARSLSLRPRTVTHRAASLLLCFLSSQWANK
jgi:hypothetical protein